MFEFGGILSREILRLGEIGRDVVQLPVVTGDDVGRRLGAQLPGDGHGRGGRHPAVVINGAVAEHLEILGRAPGGRVGVGLVPGVSHADSVHRPLLDAVDGVGRCNTGRFQDRRHDVNDVVELGADAAHVLDMAGPGHAHALAGAAEVRSHLLGPLKGRVEGPRPADGVMRERQVRPPELIEQELVLDRHGDAVEGAKLVRSSVRRALGAGPVVAADVHDQGVIELAHVLDRLDDAANLVVGVSEVSPEHVGLLDEELLLVPAQRVPLAAIPSARP